MRGCGLKFRPCMVLAALVASSSMRGCGLKLIQHIPTVGICIVILYARMWIEMKSFPGKTIPGWSSSMRGCGLKSYCPCQSQHTPDVILYARMWIEILGLCPSARTSGRHPLCEDVDWNNIKDQHSLWSPCHPLCEDVDWNRRNLYIVCPEVGSSSMRGCGLKCVVNNVSCLYKRSSSMRGCGLK